MQVWLSPGHEEPRIHASIIVRAGAAEDPDDATGVAHYLEHMLANKGTEKLGTVDAAAEAPLLARVSAAFEALRQTDDHAARTALRAEIEAAELAAQAFAVPNELKLAWSAMGGRGLNASTSHERTNYYVDLPAEMLPRWAALEADRFSSPVFRAFSTEVRTICEEKSRALDDAGRMSKDALARVLWGEHPYGRPVLGELEHLASPSVVAMRQFVSRWYVPENMAVVLAGDFGEVETLALLERTLGQLPRGWTDGAPGRLRQAAPPALVGETTVEVQHHGQGAVHIGWLTVPRGHPDAAALRMVDLLLSNGRTGLLDRELVKAKKARGAGAWMHSRAEGGVQVLWGNPLDDQDPDELADLLLFQLQRIQDGEIDSRVMAAVQRSFEVAELSRLETNAGRVQWMTQAVVAGWGVADAREMEARLRAVEPADVVRVARQWLGPDRVRVTRRPGLPTSIPVIDGLPPEPRPIETSRHSDFYSEVLGMPVAPTVPRVLKDGAHFVRRERPSGLVIGNANPFSELTQVQVLWDHGSADDVLLGAHLRLLSFAGTAALDTAELALQLHENGVQAGTSVRRGESALWIAGPAAGVEAMSDRVLERFAGPVLPDALRTQELDDLLARRRQARSTRRARVDAAREWVLHGDLSGFLARTPSPEALESLKTADLRTRGERLLSRGRDVLVTGPVDLSALSGWMGPDDARPFAEPGPWRRGRARAPGVYVLHHESAQASVTVYRCAGVRGTESPVSVGVVHAGLSGPAGLVFQQLREARALAYATGGGLSRGERPGDDNLLWGNASTEPARASEAVLALVGILQDGLPELVSDDSLVARAHGRLTSQLQSERVAFRSVPGCIRNWHRRGFRQDPRPQWRSELAGLGPAELRAFIGDLALSAPRVVIVGDVHRMDLDPLARLGPVVVLGDVDVFGPDAAA